MSTEHPRTPGAGAPLGAAPSPRTACWALGVCVVVAGSLTLGPLPMGLLRDLTDVLASAAGVPARPLDQSVEKLCNIAMFIPATALLALALPRAALWRVFAAAVLTSAAVEVAQLVAVPGRHPSLLDILLNTTGAALGIAVAHHLRRAPRTLR